MDLHIPAYFAGARAAAGQHAPLPRPLTASELESWREGYLEHRAEHLALLAEPFVNQVGDPLPILIPPCEAAGAADALRLDLAAPRPEGRPLTVSCPCPSPVPGQPVVRHPECREHPSGNRWLARALVLAARNLHPDDDEAFRAEARAALEVAGCIEPGASVLRPDDPRSYAALDDPTTVLRDTGDPMGSPQQAARAFARRSEVPDTVPAGLRGAPIPVVTKGRTGVRSDPTPPSSATQAPAPAMVPPVTSAEHHDAAVAPPPADDLARRRRGRAAAAADRRRRPTAAELRAAGAQQ